MTDDLAAQIAALQQQLAELEAKQAVVSINNNNQQGANITLSGTFAGRDVINVIIGRDADEEEQRALSGYLVGLRERLRPLVLRGLSMQLDEQGNRPALPEVYTTLATTGLEELAVGSFEQIAPFFADLEKGQLTEEYDPDHALPATAVVRVVTIAPKGADRIERRRLLRSRLASEAAGRDRRMVLLGAPGSGKTTFLRHLAWSLAARACGDDVSLPGWDTAERRRQPRDGKARPAQLLPVIVSLRELAGRLHNASDAAAVVRAAVRDELARGGRSPVLMDRLLDATLDTGAVLLLCDGLDEVPLDGATTANRTMTLLALRDFAATYPHARLLLTCRTRAFGEDMRTLVNWRVEELAPLTVGQIRHLTRALYTELATCAVIPFEQEQRLSDELIGAITNSDRLRQMAETPLLLTLMAFVLVNQGALPSDRPLLYERVLDLLLGQWDKIRDGETLAQAIGQPDWDAERLAPLLNQLSYQAHRDTTVAGERGGIKRLALYDALGTFFAQAKINAPMAAAERCLHYFEQRSGLLVPDESDSYTFVHLTLQEHCAGRYLVSRPNPVGEIMAHRGDDRWREPIFLGLGLTQRQTPYIIVEVLRRLIDRNEQHAPKEAARWERDLILAAELAEDRRWERLAEAGVQVDELQNALRNGLVELLDDQSGTLPLEERIRAGYALGRLGDPRLDPRRDDYWCRIPAGWVEVDGEQVWVEEFMLAKYPVTWQDWIPFRSDEYKEIVDGQEYDIDTIYNRPFFVKSLRMYDDIDKYCIWVCQKLGFHVRIPKLSEWCLVNKDMLHRYHTLPVGCGYSLKHCLMDVTFDEISKPLSQDEPWGLRFRLARDVPKQ